MIVLESAWTVTIDGWGTVLTVDIAQPTRIVSASVPARIRRTLLWYRQGIENAIAAKPASFKDGCATGTIESVVCPVPDIVEGVKTQA